MFTRLFSTFMILCMFSLVSMAQSWDDYTLSPDDGNCSVSSDVGTEFTITFPGKEKVYPVKGGKISLNAADGAQMYPIQFLWDGTSLPAEPWVFESSISDGTVTFSGNQVIINFNTALPELTNYYITVHPQSIRDAQMTQFAGLLGDATVDDALTCNDDDDYGWDFTVEDVTLPSVSALSPADEASNASTTAPVILTFNVDMDWADAYSDEEDDLEPGDIAIYTSTDPNFGQYGGDVIAHTPDDVIVSGNTISIQFPELPATTNMYVRIKEGIFKKAQECEDCNEEFLWEGFNGNGQDELLNDNGEWNFRTKDDNAPDVAIAAVDVCGDDEVTQTTNFTITLDEDIIYTNDVLPFVALENGDDVKDYVVFEGAGITDYTAVITSLGGGEIVITVNPSGNLVSGETYTVTLTGDLWDESLNMVPETSEVFTAGDFEAPVFSTLEAVSEDGTTFQILANADETATVYYVVVEKVDEAYAPTFSQLTSLATTWDEDENDDIPQMNPFWDINYPLDDYYYSSSVGNINVWAAGTFNMNTAGEDVLERVFDLPRTNGTEYVVFAYAIDNSACGPYNTSGYADEGWATAQLKFDATTTDALPPVPTFSAETHATQNCYTRDGWQDAILRDGPIFIDFNEPIELVDGDITSGADIAAAFVIETKKDPFPNVFTQVAISDASYYDAANMRIVLIPEESFNSDYKVHVLMPINTVKDLSPQGNERNLAADHYFCVENYCEPELTWAADLVEYGAEFSRTVMEDQSIVECNTGVSKDATITLTFDMDIFNASGDSLTNGGPAATDVANFIKVRESAIGCPEAETGALIYDLGNLTDFDVTVAYGGNNSQTVITVTPVDFEFRSEYFYNVQVEGSLQSYSGRTILDNDCYPDQSNSISFQVEDHLSPEISFFEADGTTNLGYLDACETCDQSQDPALGVDVDSRIGVVITEWIELGFDGWDVRDLEETEGIADANALRRYFSLKDCEGNEISFDVVDFLLDATGDSAVMFIDPYYPNGVEDPNFSAGAYYTVEFLSNLFETDYPAGAFRDDAGNLVNEYMSCFVGYQEPVAPVCGDQVVVGPQLDNACGGVTTDLAAFNVTITFDHAMQDSLAGKFQIAVIRDTATTLAEAVLVADYDDTWRSLDGTTFVLDMDNSTSSAAALIDTTNYIVVVVPESLRASGSELDCVWPAAGVEVGTTGMVQVAAFTTGDASAPILLTEVEGYNEIDSLDIDFDNIVLDFSETVEPVDGQVLEIFEDGTNTKVATVAIESCSFDGSTVTIPRTHFAANLDYDMTYYVQFNEGLVADVCGNPIDTAFLVDAADVVGSFWFNTKTDPRPYIICESFIPDSGAYVNDERPTLTITFSEAVVPVAGKYIQIYEQGTATSNYVTFPVDMMEAQGGGTSYSIDMGDVFDLAGIIPEGFVEGACYDVNIDTLAFVEATGTQATDKMITQVTAVETEKWGCGWSFCIGDIICPNVTFWPQNGYENVPVNAHLFVQFDEPVELSSGMELNTVTAAPYFELTKGGVPVDFRVQEVATDKTWVMIVPEDPDAPELATTDNVHMEDDVLYVLTVDPTPGFGGWGTLQDAAGNIVGDCVGDRPLSAEFRTEDITCPTEEGTFATADIAITGVNAAGFTLSAPWTEVYGNGTIAYTVTNAVSGDVVAQGTKAVTTATPSFTVSGINATEATGYLFDIELVFTDDEVQEYTNDTRIMQEWPYQDIAGLETIRIKDLNTDANTCTVDTFVTLCDDDSPILVDLQDDSGATAVASNMVPVTSNLHIVLNEVVDTTGLTALTPHQIALRDYENNLLIPAVFTITGGGEVITIDPVDPLLDEHRYYVTWDRYAIHDDNENICGKDPNFLAEQIDKTLWFKTMDNTAPVFACEDIIPNSSCTERDQDIVITVSDGNEVTVNPAYSSKFIDIYEQGTSIPHERISINTVIKEFVEINEAGDSVWTFTFPTVYEYLSGACYEAIIPGDLFVDSFGNETEEDGCTIDWCTEDYLAPVATWVAKMDYSYIFEAYTDDDYVTDWESGIAGEELVDVPTSSYFVVALDEDAQVWDADDEEWRDLHYAQWDPMVLQSAITVTNEGETLTMFEDYWVQYLWSEQVFRIIISNDESHYGHGSFWPDQPYLFGSMKSNSQYEITLNEGMLRDDPECGNHNYIEETTVLTVTTRDDTPPQLTMKDANGDTICDASCYGSETYMNYEGGQEPFWNWDVEWPGSDFDTDPCNVCVVEGDYIELAFDKPIVKTPGDVASLWPFNPQGGVDWWTEANLGLDESDFIPEEGLSKYFRMARLDGHGWEFVDYDHVEIVGDSIFRLYFAEDLASEGIYRATFAPYMVKDQLRIPDGNEFLGLTCVFQVVDHEAPVAEYGYSDSECEIEEFSGLYPMDVDTTARLYMTFNEPVQKGSGSLIIRRENGQQQQIIDASDVTISEDGYTVYVNNANFEENTLYYVEIEPGFVTDFAECGDYQQNNPFAGINPEDSQPGWQSQIPNFEWVFATGDNTPPTPDTDLAGEEFFPMIDADNVAKNTTLEVIFDENVYTDCVELPEECEVFEYTVSDYLGDAMKGFYVYADNGENTDVDFGNFVKFIPFFVYQDEEWIQNPAIQIEGTDIYNGLTNNKVIVDPDMEFERNYVYYVRVSGNLFCDDFGNKWAGIRDNSWTFTITNDVAPMISAASPILYTEVGAPETIESETNGYAVSDLTMWFVDEIDEEPLMVAKGSGTVKIYEYIYNPNTFNWNEKLFKTIDINDPSVVIENNMVTIKDVLLEDGVNQDPDNCMQRMYYVTVDPGAITNGYEGSLTYWEGFNDPFDWRFYTSSDDTFMVGHTIIEPTDINLSIEAASTLKIQFAEGIEAWDMPMGGVKIYTAADSVLVDSITVTDADIDGDMLTVMTDALVDETEYFVLIDAGAFGDTSSCSTPFYGLDDATEWTFHTGDNTPPVPVWAADLTDCESTCVTVTFTVDETNGVTASEGMINLWTADTIFASMPATVSGDDMNTISAEFCDLPDTTVFMISVDTNAVKDNGNNALANMEIADPSWTFATADNTLPVVTGLAPAGDTIESMTMIVVEATEYVMPVEGKMVMVEGLDTFDVTEMVSEDGWKYMLAVEGLEDETTYTVTIEAGAFQDSSCAMNVTAEATVWSFTTDDNTAPVIIATSPEDQDTLDTYIGMDVSFTFNEEVAKGMGDITITRGDSVLVVPVSSDAVTVNGMTVTVALEDMLYFGEVTVEVAEGTFVDMAIKPNDSEAKTWSFDIVDETAPNCMTIVSPVDGANDVEADVDLVMDFCEKVAPGDVAKMLKVYSVLEVQGGLDVNELFIETAITADMISDSTVTVPLTGLADETSYIVMIDYDAIRDEAGNAYEGINDPTMWNFTTADNTAPTVVLTPDTILDAENTIVLTAEFSEEVVGAETEIMVEGATSYTVEMNATNDVATITIDAADLDTVMVTIPTTITDVPDGKGYGNELAEAATGFYVVADNTAPAIVTHSPEGDLENAHPESIVIEFTEDVTLGSGSITVYNEDGTVALDVPTDSVTVEGNVVSFDLAGSFDKFATYYVLVDSGFVSDAAGNVYEGLSDITDWVFNTGDFVTDVKDLVDEIDYKVYPNPFNSFIRIDNNDKLDRVVISNIAGQRVLDIENPTYEISTGNLVTGVYVVTLISNDEIVKSERIIKR